MSTPGRAHAGSQRRTRRQLAALWRRVRARLLALRPACTPEGVHQARIALRRLRSVLAAIEPAVDTRTWALVQHELDEFMSELGAVRDADVRCDLLLQPQIVEATSSRARLARTLRVERSRARRRLRAMLRSASTARRLRTIGDVLGAASFLVAGADPEALLVNSTRCRCRKLARSLERGRTGNAARRHQLRIRVKKCRYLLDACGVEPDSGRNRKTLARLHDLQDCLGDLNDVAQTRRWLKQEAKSDSAAVAREVLRARKRRSLARLARLRAQLRPGDVIGLLK